MRKYEKIFDDNVRSWKQVNDRLKHKCKTREKIRSENSSHHGFPQVDALYVALFYRNGNK